MWNFPVCDSLPFKKLKYSDMNFNWDFKKWSSYEFWWILNEFRQKGNFYLKKNWFLFSNQRKNLKLILYNFSCCQKFSCCLCFLFFFIFSIPFIHHFQTFLLSTRIWPTFCIGRELLVISIVWIFFKEFAFFIEIYGWKSINI